MQVSDLRQWGSTVHYCLQCASIPHQYIWKKKIRTSWLPFFLSLCSCELPVLQSASGAESHTTHHSMSKCPTKFPANSMSTKPGSSNLEMFESVVWIDNHKKEGKQVNSCNSKLLTDGLVSMATKV